MIEFLCIIQARLGSTRLPNKVLQTVGGVPMVKRVWDAANSCMFIGKTIVAWPERYPDLDETNVLERFRRVSKEFPSQKIIRLTADCPLLTARDIMEAILEFDKSDKPYYNNNKDGHDVQICTREYLFDSFYTHREHVFNDFTTKDTGMSVNTKEDLERVRGLWKTK